MTRRDEVIRMAEQAGITFVTKFGVASATPEWIERFAALVAAAERERCAKSAQEFCTQGRSPIGPLVSAAIRALKDEVSE